MKNTTENSKTGKNKKKANREKIQQTAKLTVSIDELKNTLEKTNSTRRTFLLGMVRGVGAVVGASVVAGLLLGWAASTFNSLSNVPVVGELFTAIIENTELPAATSSTSQ